MSVQISEIEVGGRGCSIYTSIVGIIHTYIKEVKSIQYSDLVFILHAYFEADLADEKGERTRRVY